MSDQQLPGFRGPSQHDHGLPFRYADEAQPTAGAPPAYEEQPVGAHAYGHAQWDSQTGAPYFGEERESYGQGPEEAGHAAGNPYAPPYAAYEQQTPERGYTLPEVPESAWSSDARRGVRLGRVLLLCILLIQAVLSLRLHGTAFEDEALYIGAGHYEVANLRHGTPLPLDFAGYFSGHPKLYPVLAAVVDTHFGLAGVRLVSLVFMLAATALLYAMTRRMFNLRAALGAAALFSVVQSTVFLGNFATFDAAAILLLALSAWVVVRTGRMPVAAVLLAAPPAALAFGVKYASGIYLPTLVVLAVLTAYRHRSWLGLARGALLGVGIAGLLGAGMYASGPLGGISGTTTNRAHGADSALTLLQHSAEWGGLLFLAAVGGSIAYARRARIGEMPWVGADTPGTVRRISLGVLLTGTALLAPAYQIHLGTETSLFKHVGFGLLFAAPMAGLGMERLVGRHFRYPQLGIMLFVVTLMFGMVQSHEEYSFPDSRQMVAYLRTIVDDKGTYLAEENEVPAYYLRDVTTWNQWQSTFAMDYQGKNGKHYSGTEAFAAAVHDGRFDAIVLRGGVTPDTDQAVTEALRGNSQYRLAAVLPFTTSNGTGAFRIWVKQ